MAAACSSMAATSGFLFFIYPNFTQVGLRLVLRGQVNLITPSVSYFRYDDYNFFGETRSDQDTTVCGNNSSNNNSNSAANSATNSSSGVYKANAMALVRNLSGLAPKNDGFFVGSVERKNVSVYGLAQCWEFVNGSACERCLADAVTRIGSCSTQEARALSAGCYLRYSSQKFYNNSSDVVTAGKHGELCSLFWARFFKLWFQFHHNP